MTAKYVVGLVDGEGSFTVFVRDPDSRIPVKRRTRVEPRFFLKLVEEDREALDELKTFFGCGSVYVQKDARPSHRDCYRYEVSNRRDLENVIIPFFERNALRLRSKRRDFEVFRHIFGMILRKEHLTDVGWRRIYAMKREMH